MQKLNRNWLWLPGVAVAALVFYFFSDILAYILLAWVFSMLGRPIMVFLLRRVRIRRWRLGISGAALLTILSFYIVLAGVLMVFVPTLVQQTRNLAEVNYQQIGEKLQGPFAELDLQLHALGLLGTGESLATRVQAILSSVFKPTILGDVVGSVIAIAGSVVVTVSVVTFILFFFLREKNLFGAILRALVPNDKEKQVLNAIEESSNMLTRYFGGLVIQIVTFSGILSLFLWIMGIDSALLIGASGGIFNVVPYVGPIFGMIFGCFITISSHLDYDFNYIWPMLLKVLGAFAATQFIDNNFVGPTIFSKSVKAHPLEIFLVTLVAAKIGGVVGMVIGIPVYTILRVILKVFFSEFKLVQQLTDRMDADETA